MRGFFIGKIPPSKIGKVGFIMNKLRISVMLALISVTAFARAGSGITYTGTFESSYPVLNIDSTEQPVAHVKDFILQAKEEGGICNIITDPTAAEESFSGGHPLCLFEWTGDSHGLTMTKLKGEGVLSSEGQVGFDYQVSIINAGEKTVLFNDTYNINAEIPITPIVTGVKGKWRKGLREGGQQITYNKADELLGWEVEVEKRPYHQLLRLNESDCKVSIGETTCLIALQPFSPGVDSEDVQGIIEQDLYAVDQKSYFKNVSSTDLTINWDYRSPTALGFAYNAGSEGTIKHINIDGVDVAMPPEEAVMVVSSPHIGKEGQWWKLQQSRLVLKTELGAEHSDVLEVEGTRIRFEVPNFMYRSEFVVEPIGEPEITGGALVYRYNIEKVPDGNYNVEALVEDANNNGASKTYSNNIIDRYAPDIKALIGDTQLREGSGTDLYFLNDLTFVANGGWPDGTEISSVKINTQEAARESSKPFVTQLLNTNDILPGTTLEVAVTAIDGAGNEAVKTYELNYMPVSFEMYDKPDRLYSRVQETSMYLTQTSGMKCFMSGTEELAIMISGSIKKGCTVNFTELPDGLSPTFTGSFYKLEGAITDVGQMPVSYQVVYYNNDGAKVVAYEDSFIVDVIEPDPIKLDITDYNKISDGVYSIPYNGRIITRYEMDTVPARVKVNIENPFYTEQEEISQRRMNAAYKVRNTLHKKSELTPNVWDVIPFKINAYHMMDEFSKDTAEFDLVVTPTTRTRVYAEPTVDEATTLDALKINARVGIYDRRTKDYDYSQESMGDWKMHLA